MDWREQPIPMQMCEDLGTVPHTHVRVALDNDIWQKVRYSATQQESRFFFFFFTIVLNLHVDYQ